MLNPNKHTNLQYSVINTTGNIIDILLQNGIVSYNELFGILELRLGKQIKENGLYSISFLYCMGKIEYLSEIDSFKLK